MDKGKRPEEPEAFQTPIVQEPVDVDPVSQVPPTPPVSPVKTTDPPPVNQPSIFETLYSKASGGEQPILERLKDRFLFPDFLGVVRVGSSTGMHLLTD